MKNATLFIVLVLVLVVGVLSQCSLEVRVVGTPTITPTIMSTPDIQATVGAAVEATLTAMPENSCAPTP